MRKKEYVARLRMYDEEMRRLGRENEELKDRNQELHTANQMLLDDLADIKKQIANVPKDCKMSDSCKACAHHTTLSYRTDIFGIKRSITVCDLQNACPNFAPYSKLEEPDKVIE